MENKKVSAADRLRTAALLAPFAVAGLAGAQTTAGAGEISLDGAQTNVMALIAVGVAITTALTVYRLGKRGARSV